MENSPYFWQFFSQKLYHYLFPFKPISYLDFKFYFWQILKKISRKDAFTRVRNRCSLDMRLKEEVEKNKRCRQPLSIIMFDVDYFNKVNDTYGHSCGDFILQQIAGTIEKIMKNHDTLARYGREKFCCLLPETPIEETTFLAERFRKKIPDKTTAIGTGALTSYQPRSINFE